MCVAVTPQNLAQQVMEESASPSSISANNGALDLRMRRGSNDCRSIAAIDSCEEEKENHLMNEQFDHEDIVCAPSIPLILSSSFTCSTPLPSPLSPELQSSLSRPDKVCSTSPKLMIRTTKTLKNGVLPKSGTSIDRLAAVENKSDKSEIFTTPNTPSAVSGLNLPEMLMATKELHFTPEIIPHLTAIQQMNSAVKRPSLHSVANAPLGLLSHVSLGSTVMPDLVDPTILNLLNSELARRLTTGSVSSNVSQYMRQGTWKCEDCNIGFCKYENYTAHKKHYCSTRKVPESTQSDDSMKTSPLGSPSSRNATVSPSSQSPAPSQQVAPPPAPSIMSTNILQNGSHKSAFPEFVCSTCGIKYSSLDNLTTHQTFYCPNRSATAVVIDDDKSSLKCCSKCKVLLPTDQLPTHECIASSDALGWKCPCCYVICNSTNAIQKHFESHDSIKAFLCTICNYKGNTIRGMRTHIRVHFDKRSGDIVEENFISCLMDDSTGINTTGENATEKNTKKLSLERVQLTFPSQSKSIMETSSTPVMVPEKNSSPIMLENVDEEEEYIEVDELPNAKSELLQNEITAAVSDQNSVDDITTSTLMTDYKSPQEVVDNLSMNSNQKYDPKYCKSCDISFKYLPTFLAHKKYYCSSQSSDENISSINGSESIPVVIPTNLATAAHT